MIEHSHPEPEERGETTAAARTTFPADESLRQELRLFRDNSGGEWTNAKIAQAIGYTPRVISDYLNAGGNKYDGDAREVEVKLREWLRDIQLELDSSVPVINCEIADQIEIAVENIRTSKGIGVIIGEPGIGKSCGIGIYSKRHTLAIAFTTRSWHRNTASMCNCLLEAADVTQTKSGLKAFELFVEKSRGMTRPILVDDAHKLTRGALQLLYDFRDATGAPIALFGDDRLLAKLKDDSQRLRRTSTVTRLKIRDPKPLIEHHIDSLVPDANGDRDELRKLARQIVDKAGRFGSLQMELALAVRLKRGAPDWSWSMAVQAAHKKLIRDYEFTAN
jgi:DNA transposition AAA+ family ATPase